MRRSFVQPLLLGIVIVLPSACGLWVIDDSGTGGDTDTTTTSSSTVSSSSTTTATDDCEVDLTTKKNCGFCGWACDGEHLECVPEKDPYSGAYCQDTLTGNVYFDEAANGFRGWRTVWIAKKASPNILDRFGFGGAITMQNEDPSSAWNDPLHIVSAGGDYHCVNPENSPNSIDCWLGPQPSQMSILLTPTWYKNTGPEVSGFSCDDKTCDGSGIVTFADDQGIHEICSVQNSQVTPDTNCALVPHFDPTLKHLDLSFVVP